MFRKILDEGQAGDNVGYLLRGTKREEIERGQVLCKPGSVTPQTKFTAQVYCLKKEEGGRHTPFFNGYLPQFYFLFFFYCCGDHRDLHSFPTRRSSDLTGRGSARRFRSATIPPRAPSRARRGDGSPRPGCRSTGRGPP